MAFELARSGMGALSIAPNLIAALVLGSLIGMERQWHQRYTGLATYALVALGAASFSTIPSLLNAGGDPTRIGSQVVTGIGFLGAGLIMRDGLSVRGLSTAATVWATGAIGVMAGYGLLIEAAEATGVILFANIVFRRVGRFIERAAPEDQFVERFYVLEVKGHARDEVLLRTRILQAVSERKVRLHGLESHAVAGSDIVEVEAMLYCQQQEDGLVESIVGDLCLTPQTISARWTSSAPPD